MLTTADAASLDVSTVARMLGIGASTVRRLADTGALRCQRIVPPGSKSAIRRFRPEWVAEFQAGCETGPAPKGAPETIPAAV
jgi:hypothetical protein